MQKPDRGALLCFGLTTLLYLILDLAVQMTGYLSFGPIVGLKNFIPATVGLFFGLYAVLGTCVGCLIGALILSLVGLPFTVAFLIFTAVLQLCDAYIVKPKLFGNSLGVSSLWILIGIIVGGRMFGAVGVLLAIPAVAILDFLYTDYILPRLEAREQKPIM